MESKWQSEGSSEESCTGVSQEDKEERVKVCLHL